MRIYAIKTEIQSRIYATENQRYDYVFCHKNRDTIAYLCQGNQRYNYVFMPSKQRYSQATSHYLNQWWLVYRRIYASFGLNEKSHHEWPQNRYSRQRMYYFISYTLFDVPEHSIPRKQLSVADFAVVAMDSLSWFSIVTSLPLICDVTRM